MAVTQQYGAIFLAWFVYDGNGKPVWYVVPDCTVVGSKCDGTVYKTTGAPLGPTFNPSSVQAIRAGTLSMTFTDADTATITYTVDGVTSSKTVTRQLF